MIKTRPGNWYPEDNVHALIDIDRAESNLQAVVIATLSALHLNPLDKQLSRLLAACDTFDNFQMLDSLALHLFSYQDLQYRFELSRFCQRLILHVSLKIHQRLLPFAKAIQLAQSLLSD